jgi:hypothetical protein
MTAIAHRIALLALGLVITGSVVAPAAVAQSLDLKGWADGFGQVGNALQLQLGGDDSERSPTRAPAGSSAPGLSLPSPPSDAPTPPPATGPAGAWQPTVKIAPGASSAPKPAPSGWAAKVSG